MRKKKKSRGRPKGSKNKERKEKVDVKKKTLQEKRKPGRPKKVENKEELPPQTIVRDPTKPKAGRPKKDKTIKPLKKFARVKLKLNNIYNKNKKFFTFNRYSFSISKWEPGQEKIPFNEKKYIILDKFPTEKEYYNLVRYDSINKEN